MQSFSRRLISHRAFLRLFNMGLRMFVLATKMALTIYITLYLGLSDLGTFGLIAGAMMTAGPLLGLRLEYIVGREIVGMHPELLIRRMRDEALFFVINYLIFALLVGAVIVTEATELPYTLLITILILSVTDNFGQVLLFTNLVSMGKPVLANMLFTIRTGMWAVPAILLGWADEEYRTLEFVLNCWIVGIIASNLITFYFLRSLPWRHVVRSRIDWAWMMRSVKKSLPMCFGTVTLATGIYMDRFVVEHFIGLTAAGVATFYFSFSNALFTLIQSGVFTFAQPKLVARFREGDMITFRRETRAASREAMLYAALIGVLIGAVVPYLGQLIGKQALYENAWTLWLMLIGTWIRVQAETPYFVLYAAHADRPIWTGNLIYAIPALGGNILLVPLLGLQAIGYSAIIAGIMLYVWRAWYARRVVLQRTQGTYIMPTTE